MAENLTTATIDVRANTRNLEKDILKALKTVEFSEINTKKSSQALGRITGQVSEFNKSLEASNARVIAFGASAGAIFAVEKAFSSLITSTIDVEKRLADINVLLNASSSTIQKFGDSLFGIAKNTAQSFSEVADAATELARQGLGIEETLKRTNAALILTRLSGLDAKSSVEALTATLNSFSGSGLDAVEVINKLANVDAAFAVSSADLANAISRVGSTAVDAGVSLDELIALVTSAQQTTARGGAVIGNSFKTIFTRLQRGKVQELLGSLGVDTNEGQSAVSLLQQLATTYDTLGAAQKSYIAEQVGGVFQINILKAALADLGKEYSIYGRALDTSLTSTDQAIKRNELLNQTVSALSSQAYANLEQAASKIGTLVFEPNAKGFLSGINDLLSAFNNIDAESAGGKLMEGFFKGVGDFIGGPGAVLATAVLVKLFSRLTQFAAGSAKELLGTTKAAQQQAAIEQSILSILQKNSQFTSQILSGKMTTVQAEKELLNYLTAQSNILREQERLSKVIGTNLRMAGVSVGASGVPMVAAAGKGKKAAASGYVPNFAADQAIGQAMENAGAKEHGYKAGKARKTRIHDGNGKSFTSFVNSKEDVKTFTNAAGKKATIVRPPNGFGENTQYAAGGFVPNFVKFSFNKADDSLAFKRKKIDKISLANFKDQKLLEDQNIADAGYDKKGNRNSIFDTITGEVIRKRFIKKERFEKIAEKQFNNYISGNNVSEIAKNSFDRGLSKNYPGKNLEEVKKIILSNKRKNKKAFIGDFSNAKGALYESFVSKKAGDKYELSEDEYSRADLFAKAGSGAEYAGIEAKSGRRDLKDILFKAISSSIRNKNQDEKDDLNFGKFALYETFSSGFIPNFASMKASDTMTRMVMEKFYPIKDAAKFKEEYAKQSFKPAALKALYRERVEGAATSNDLSNRAAAANKITSDEAARAKVKDLGKIDYTMIHATEGSKPLSSEVVSYKKKDKKTGEETRYIASLSSASLDNKKLNNASVQQRVGDALVDESNKLSAIFNPSGGAPFSDYKQLSNSGSVMSAAGTVFESAVRQAFKVPAQGQTARIDFPNPSSQLRSFFHNAPGDYEAKISNSQDNLSSALSKYIAVNGLAEGYVPNFAKSSGLSFSQTKKDEFGFKELRAAIGGKNVGAFSYAEDKRGEVEIGDFTVDKKHRGKGYGTALYQEAIKRNKGKKMKGQLLPQMNRLLEKIKKGEPVSAETLYPQIKRADLAKSSVFEVYGHKGMAVEKMTRDEFSSFVNAKINELKKDPKRLQSYFGNVEADEYGGLGIGLTTQHSSGFIPNFLDVTKGKLPIGVRGRTNYGSGGSKTNIQLGAGAEESTLAHELFHSAYSRSTFDKAKSNDKIGKFISSPRQYAGSGALIGDQVFKNLNKNNLIKSVGLNPVQLDFDGKNPSASYSGERAVDEIITRVQEKIFKNKGNLEALSVDEKTFAENLQRLGIISNKRLSNVSRHSKEGSKFRSLVENKFSSIASSSSGFVPNFASSSLINEINKRISNPNVAIKLAEGSGLNNESYIKVASRLGVNTSGLDSFLPTNIPPAVKFPLKGRKKVLGLSKALGFSFGRSSSIQAIKLKDWDYVKSSFEKNGLTKSDFDSLIPYARSEKGENNLIWGFKSKAGGFVPNFANITSSPKSVRKKAYANQSSLNTFRVVHPLNPKIDAQGRVSFPDLEKIKGSAKIIHNEGMEGQNVFTIPSFLDFVNSRGNKQTFFRRNSFDYILSSAGYVPNFADALNSAISRERSAGLSKNQIYVDQHDSLKNKNNPMGLMVANTRDEPKGGIQGIKRAKKEGRNPKTYAGASSGFVPNFALFSPDQEDVDALKELNSALKSISEKIKDAADNFSVPDTENKVKKMEARKARLETVAPKLTSTEILKSKSDVAAAEQLKSQAQQSGNKTDIDAADKLLAEERKKLAKQEAALKAKIEARVKSLDEQIKAGKDSVVAYKKEQAALLEEKTSIESRRSSQIKGMGAVGRSKKFLSKNAMGLGFGLQTVAGMAGEFAGNDDTVSGRTTKAVAGGIGDIASFTGTGAMIAGPYGAAAGFAVGLGKAALDVTKALNTKVPDLEKGLQTSSDSMNRFGESGQKLLQLNEQYADALSSGGDPAKTADLLSKTQKAYAEELSKLTETQRGAMISAIAQGKGQEAYAKVLEEMQQKVKLDETALTFQKFVESQGIFGADKSLLKGLDQSLSSDFLKGLDKNAVVKALSAASPALEDKTAGTEGQAIALMKALASSDSLKYEQKINLEKVIKGFEQAASQSDLSGVAKSFIESIKDKPAAFDSVAEYTKAVEEEAKNRRKKEQEEIAIREATNARLLKLQADTDSIYQKFNDGVRNLITAMETASTMRENTGEFKANYLEQSGANQNIIDVQKQSNIIRSSNDQLQIGKYKTQFDTMQNFRSEREQMLSSLSIDAAKANLQDPASSQGAKLNEIRSLINEKLLPIESLISEGKYDQAGADVEKVLNSLPGDIRNAVGPDAIVTAINNLKNVTDQGNRDQETLVENSRRDLGIQAQQLIFQKAMGKLNQAQNYGGSIKDIITNSPENPFNQTISALGKLKMTGYNQAGLHQGKTNAVKGAWQGKEGETWGINGKKPTTAMNVGLIDFYKAASQIGGESVISTESKDFKVLTQAISESIRTSIEKLKLAGDGAVDPAVFTRLESTLQGLGGDDEVAKLKIMKELGYANISGKKIMDKALGGYTGGAFAGLDPELKKAFESTSDETASATLLLVAGQKKQTDSLNQGLNLIGRIGDKTNELLSIQPQAIAQAIGAILEKGRAEEKVNEKIKESKTIGEDIFKTETQIKSNETKIQNLDKQKEAAEKVLGKTPANMSESDFLKLKESEIDQDKLKKARETVAYGLNERRAAGLEVPAKLLAALGDSAMSFSTFAGDWATLGMTNDGLGRGGFEEQNKLWKESAGRNWRQAIGEENISTAQDPDTIKNFNEALALIDKASAIETLKKNSSTIAEKQKENEGLSEKKKELEAKQANIAPEIETAAQYFEQAVKKAAEAQSNVLSYDRSAIEQVNSREREALIEKNRRENAGGAYQTERQKEAIKKSSPNYKITSGDGEVRTIEKDAIYRSGAQSSERARVGSDEFLNRLNKAFQMIDQQNALPSFEKFKDVYAQIGGGKEYAKKAYEDKKAEKFGYIPDQKAKRTSSVPDAINETNRLLSEQPQAIADAMSTILGQMALFAPPSLLPELGGSSASKDALKLPQLQIGAGTASNQTINPNITVKLPEQANPIQNVANKQLDLKINRITADSADIKTITTGYADIKNENVSSIKKSSLATPAQTKTETKNSEKTTSSPKLAPGPVNPSSSGVRDIFSKPKNSLEVFQDIITKPQSDPKRDELVKKLKDAELAFENAPGRKANDTSDPSYKELQKATKERNKARADLQAYDEQKQKEGKSNKSEAASTKVKATEPNLLYSLMGGNFLDRFLETKPSPVLEKTTEQNVQEAIKQPDGFIEWAKQMNKVSKDFSLTKEQKTGQVDLPPDIKKLREEYLSEKGAKSNYGRITASQPEIAKIEAEQKSRKQLAEKEKNIESMKPKLTGSRMISDGKGGTKSIAAPGNPQEALQQAQYETAKRNIAYEKARSANLKTEAPSVGDGQEQVVKIDSEKKLANQQGQLRAAESVVRLDEQIKKLEANLKANPADTELQQKLEIAKGSRTDFAKIATGGDREKAYGLDSESAKTLRDQLKTALQEGLSADNVNQTAPIKKTLNQDQAEQKKLEAQSITQNDIEQKRLDAAPKTDQNKQEVVQQADSQSLTSILGAVNQILQFVSNPESSTAKGQVPQLASSNSSSTSASTSNVNVSTPINISVGSGNDSGAAENAANQIAQLVSQAISQMEPQIRKIAMDAATAAANKVAGNKVPPTQGMFV